LHQLSHVLEQQHMSLDQYLKLMRKTREEYIKELEPEAEQSVKRQLVLDEVAKEEKIEITPEDLESLARIYMQSGQNRTPTEEQMQTLAMSFRREKAITRLIELTPPPDEEAAEEPVGVQEQGNQEEEAGEAAILDIQDITQDQSDQAEETSGTPLLDTQNPSDQVQETLQTESENQAETEDRATTGNAPTSNVQ